MVKFTTAGLSSNIFFRGALLSEKEKEARKYISIGCRHVEITADLIMGASRVLHRDVISNKAIE